MTVNGIKCIGSHDMVLTCKSHAIHLCFRNHPFALYLFSRSKSFESSCLSITSSADAISTMSRSIRSTLSRMSRIHTSNLADPRCSRSDRYGLRLCRPIIPATLPSSPTANSPSYSAPNSIVSIYPPPPVRLGTCATEKLEG
jgi:hypothetical protein